MKSKGVKKMLALVLALSMSMTLLAGCGNNKDSKAADSQTTDGGAEAAVDSDISIGVLIWSTDDGLGADSKTALDAVAEDLNVSLVYRTGSYDAESQTTDYENLLAAGVDGILCCVMNDTSTDDLLKICEEAGIPMQIFFRNIIDEEAYNYCMASDLFAGYVCEDEGGAGVDMVDELLAQGCTTFGLLNREAGNGVIDRRQSGVMEYLDEKGLTYYVATTSNTATATDMVDATDQLLAAYSDIDALICSAGSNGSIDAIITDLQGSDIKLASFDTPVDIPGSFEAGNLVMLTTGAQIDPVYALINLYCKITGKAKSDTPTAFDSNYIYMKSVEDAATYEKYFSDFNTYSAEEVQGLVDMDLDSFVTEIGNYSLEMVAEKMK